MRLRLGLVVMVVALGIGASALFATGLGAPAGRLLTFEDRSTGATVTIETDAGSAHAGEFALRVPGRGTFIGLAGASLRSAPGQGAEVVLADYDGEIELVMPSGSSRADGRVRATLNVDSHTAELTLWYGLTSRGQGVGPGVERHHLVAGEPSRGGLQQAVSAFGSALLANDWGLVYDVASADLRGGAGRDAFAAEAAAQGGDAVVRVDIGRIGEPSTSPQGIAFSVATMNVVYRTMAGTDHTVTYDSYFVLEGGDWRLWFTVER